MTQANPFSLRAYLAGSHLVPLIAARHLRKRCARGKEDPARFREKLGVPSASRPAGQVIWMHGVGLGEVMALRGLIAILSPMTDAHFLVTCNTLQGARAFCAAIPDRTTHQYLPLDAPQYRAAFLDHWQPDLIIWTDQDIWPGLVVDAHARAIPQTIFAGRMTEQGFAARSHLRNLSAAVLGRMAAVFTQDELSTIRFKNLCAKDAKTGGSLKVASPPLTCDSKTLRHLKDAVGDRLVWITAPAHPADMRIAHAAHEKLRETYPDALLIIAPRFADADMGHDDAPRWSRGQRPHDSSVWLADTFGDLGLFYRLARAAYIGGTNDATEGHNPWEAVGLGLAIIHGPKTAHFLPDYDALATMGGAIQTDDPQVIAEALAGDLAALARNAQHAASTLRQDTTLTATTLLTHMRPADG